MMRTTLTLDDDVAAAIEHRRRELNHTLKQEVNELIRAGLMHVQEAGAQTRPPSFQIEPLDVGELLIPIDDIDEALDVAEGPWRS